jgi:Domain of unknown function (DUF4394)
LEVAGRKLGLGCAALGALAALAFPGPAAAATDSYLLIRTDAIPAGALVPFDTTNPAATDLGSRVPISGTDAQRILGIDFRPATGVLYGLSEASQLYTIDPATGQATRVTTPGAVTLDPFTGPAGPFQGMGFDWNPQIESVRVTEDDGAANGQDDNFSLNPFTGVFTQQGDLNQTGTTTDQDVAGVAFLNAVPGATSTVLYGIETNNPTAAPGPAGTDRVVAIQPNASGNLTLIDSDGDGLGGGVSLVENQEIGFDISATREARATFRTVGVYNLHDIELEFAAGGNGTGDAVLVGPIASAAAQAALPGFAVRGFAFVHSAPATSPVPTPAPEPTPEPQPEPQPVADTVAPDLELRGKRKLGKFVKVVAECPTEACTVTAEGTLKLGKEKARLKPDEAELAVGEPETLNLKLTRKASKLADASERKSAPSLVVKVTATVSDAAGNSAGESLKIKPK